MIKYFVRTTGTRILDKSYNQIEYELLIDKERKPLKSLIEQYKYISQYDCVLLEDDLILCNGFKEKIEQVIYQNSDKIINFFFAPNKWFESFDDTYSNNFHFSQCRYYPKNITAKIANELEKLDYESAVRTARYVREVANKLGYKIYQYRPCLVQHLDFDSLCQNAPNTKRTIYYIDYLKELKITYEESKEYDNTIKLRKLLKQKFTSLKEQSKS